MRRAAILLPLLLAGCINVPAVPVAVPVPVPVDPGAGAIEYRAVQAPDGMMRLELRLLENDGAGGVRCRATSMTLDPPRTGRSGTSEQVMVARARIDMGGMRPCAPGS